MTRFPRASLLALLLAAAPAHAVGLNDTGQTLCYDAAGTVISCTADDGRYGRDAAATAGALTKTGAGAAGFDFSKIANNGSVLAASAALGTGATDWACTRDNVTGLTWEVKTAGAATDLRYAAHAYTWYSSDNSTNGGIAGSVGTNTCNATLPNGQCNTQAYVAAVNAASLCGYSDWRMPSRRELRTIVHYGTLPFPSIDRTYFPNTVGMFFRYWSASTLAIPVPLDIYDVNPLPHNAWTVHFGGGLENAEFKRSIALAQLVRGGQF